MKKYCVFIFHGSANAEAVKITERLKEQFAEKLKLPFSICYLKGNLPSFSDALEQAYLKGARKIDCLPLFLMPGSHISKDIPAIIETFVKAHPDCIVKQMKCLTESMYFVDFIIKILENSNEQ